jgi:Uma2 family endonuclease
MLQSPAITDSGTFTVQLEPIIQLTDDEFYSFCQLNRELRIERTSQGEMVIMSPTSGGSSNRNANLIIEIGLWARKNRQGVIFDSSAGFILPNKAIRSPDVAWVRRERLAQLPSAAKNKFLPLAPDFIIELQSPSDRLAVLQDKMAEYIANGVGLGWLIAPDTRQVFVYQPNQPSQQLDNPATLSGDPALPGLLLDLSLIWEPEFQ